MLADYSLRLAIAAAGFSIAGGVWAWRSSPRWLAPISDNEGARLGLIALAAALSALTPGPVVTGRPAVDAAMRALLVMVVGAAGAATSPLFLAAGFVLLAGGLEGGAGAVSAAAAGVLILSVLSRARISTLGRVAAAVLIAGLATQPVPAHDLAATALPAVALGVALLGGLVGLLTGRRRRIVGAIGLVAGLIVVAGGLGGLAMVRARSHLEAGASLAQAALADARSGQVARARQELDASRSQLVEGRRRLRVWWARPAWVVPVEAVNLRAVDALATAGITLTNAGSNVMAVPLQSLTMADGRLPLHAIQGIDRPLNDAGQQLGRAQVGLGGIQSPWLLPPVSARLALMRSAVGQLAQSVGVALDAERLAVSMLGGGSGPPRRYFLAITTPSELRGATGLIANYGILVADQGKISVTNFGRMEDLARQGPKVPNGLGWNPEFVSTYEQDLTGALWQNVTISPDFPTTANAIESLYPRSGGQPVDGVVAIDPVGLSAFLAVEGPVQIALWPTPITSQNVVGIMEHDQYNQFPDVNRRLEFLTELTTKVVDRFDQANVTDLSKVVAAFGPAVRGKHILLASAGASEQARLVRIGLAGAFAPPSDDFLGVFSTNASTNKVDWYLGRSIDYRATVIPGGLQAVLTVRLHNAAPSSGQAAYFLQGTPGGPPPGTNREILSILTPWDVATATIAGQPAPLNEAAWHGLKLFSALLDVAPGSDAVVQFTLAGPRPSTAYHLDFLDQPTARPDSLHVLVRDQGRPVVDRSLTVVSDVHLGATGVRSR